MRLHISLHHYLLQKNILIILQNKTFVLSLRLYQFKVQKIKTYLLISTRLTHNL